MMNDDEYHYLVKGLKVLPSDLEGVTFNITKHDDFWEVQWISEVPRGVSSHNGFSRIIPPCDIRADKISWPEDF